MPRLAKKTGYVDLTAKILKEEGRPMTVEELTKKILEVKKVRGKTPEKSLVSALIRSENFIRLNKGLYKLVET